MRTVIAVALVALALILLFTMPGMAQMQNGLCADRSSTLEYFAERFNEVPYTRSLKKDGLLAEMLVAPSGTWTLIWTWPTGQSCVIDVGDAFEIVAKDSGT